MSKHVFQHDEPEKFLAIGEQILGKQLPSMIHEAFQDLDFDLTLRKQTPKGVLTTEIVLLPKP